MADSDFRNMIVKLYSGVPLDSSYTDTRWFASLSEQVAFFNGKAIKTIPSNSYQRIDSTVGGPRRASTIRVNVEMDSIANCNYISFNNNYPSHGKTYYCFVKSLNYINPNNTEIEYVIDYLQTYMFDFQFKPCFVIREHASAAEDEYFANLQPEPVAACAETEGEYERIKIIDNPSPTLHVCVAPTTGLEQIITQCSPPNLFGGIYNGCFYKSYPATLESIEEAASFISLCGLTGGSGSIVGVFMTPTAMTPSINPIRKEFTSSLLIRPTEFKYGQYGVHTIRNKKLASSLFTKIKCYSDTGETMEYIPEYLESGYTSAGNYVQGVISYITYDGLQAVLIPKYKGLDENYYYGVNYTCRVECMYNPTAYGSAKIGGAVTAMGIVAAAAGVGIMAAAPAIAGGLSTAAGAYEQWTQSYSAAKAAGVPTTGIEMMRRSALNKSVLAGAAQEGFEALGGVRNVGGQIAKLGANILSSAGRGSASNVPLPSQMFAMGLYGYELRRIVPTIDEAERIDQFFDMYGYAVNQLKQPNVDTRASWNYLQLQDPAIFPVSQKGMPVAAMDKIKSIFSEGIRLWHVDAVGDYSVTNEAK